LITSVSGIRGVPNHDMMIAQVAGFADKFASTTGSDAYLVGRDTRRTGDVMRRAVLAALLSRGATVYDYGVITTPAIFRESRLSGMPAVMITASHNEPEWNGLKFVVGGRGLWEDESARLVEAKAWSGGGYRQGRVKQRSRHAYATDLVERFGEGSCDGVRVAADFGGGAAIRDASWMLRRLGCNTFTVADSPGIFSRIIDPVSDQLSMLRSILIANRCDIGLAFDCDGDRLVIMDNRGRKRSGDYMLTLAISRIIPSLERKRVVVSVDTTQAVDEVVSRSGGEVFRSKVGEANVVSEMEKRGAQIGGEGSSGGLIDGGYNYCRDSMLAALTIISALKREGARLYESVGDYKQYRVAVPMKRSKAAQVVRRLARKHPEADTTDGVKIWLSKRCWVLVRPSGTEDVIRVSAEAGTLAEARKAANRFYKKLKGLSR
jgi:phosphomannomutase